MENTESARFVFVVGLNQKNSLLNFISLFFIYLFIYLIQLVSYYLFIYLCIYITFYLLYT